MHKCAKNTHTEKDDLSNNTVDSKYFFWKIHSGTLVINVNFEMFQILNTNGDFPKKCDAKPCMVQTVNCIVYAPWMARALMATAAAFWWRNTTPITSLAVEPVPYKTSKKSPEINCDWSSEFSVAFYWLWSSWSSSSSQLFPSSNIFPQGLHLIEIKAKKAM